MLGNGMAVIMLVWGVNARDTPVRVLTCKGCDRKTTYDDPIFDGVRFVGILTQGRGDEYPALACTWVITLVSTQASMGLSSLPVISVRIVTKRTAGIGSTYHGRRY